MDRKQTFYRRSHGPGFVRVYNQVRKGIVLIRTVKDEDDELLPGFPFMFPQPRESNRILGVGTGFIVNKAGYIVTCDHLIKSPKEIAVKLYNGKRYPARLVWNDKEQDIAILKIDAPGPLAALPLGSSRQSKIGEIVIAVGHPLGLTQTMTTGIISANHKHLMFTDNRMEDIIQTDCAINPGSSGGPLINMRGRVIGMNAFTAKDTHGLAFAVGIDGIKRRIGKYLGQHR